MTLQFQVHFSCCVLFFQEFFILVSLCIFYVPIKLIKWWFKFDCYTKVSSFLYSLIQWCKIVSYFVFFVSLVVSVGWIFKKKFKKMFKWLDFFEKTNVEWPFANLKFEWKYQIHSHTHVKAISLSLISRKIVVALAQTKCHSHSNLTSLTHLQNHSWAWSFAPSLSLSSTPSLTHSLTLPLSCFLSLPLSINITLDQSYDIEVPCVDSWCWRSRHSGRKNRGKKTCMWGRNKE